MLKPLEPLEAIPITHGASMVTINPSAKYIVFINADQPEDFINNFVTDDHNPFPPGTPVYVTIGDIDRAIRIYEILDTKVTSSGS